jgi:hypothetical protein
MQRLHREVDGEEVFPVCRGTKRPGNETRMRAAIAFRSPRVPLVKLPFSHSAHSSARLQREAQERTISMRRENSIGTSRLGKGRT